jgi:histidinol-phosphate/aromatic aminotransferase/cobyric acid decarboxylase-like protein
LGINKLYYPCAINAQAGTPFANIGNRRKTILPSVDFTVFMAELLKTFYKISGLPLLDLLTNVVIFRSLTAAFGISSSEAGYILTNPETINVIKDSCLLEPISSTVRNTIFAALPNEEALSSHIHQVHEESLRLVTALSRLKVQRRITTADFLLMRVADPKNVGNYLARYKAPVDNLDGYSQLETINGTMFNRRIPTTG